MYTLRLLSTGERIEGRVKHADGRGCLVELFKVGLEGHDIASSGFLGRSLEYQFNLFTVLPGQVRAGHRHPRTNEVWVITGGTGTVWLEWPDGLAGIVTIVTFDASDEALVIDLPAGTGHEIMCEGAAPVVCVYVADRLYDPDDLDVEDWSWKHGDNTS